jgi:hypothetical protein
MSEIRANTISDAAGTGPVTLTKQSAAKAWVNFNGTGTIAARDSFNVSSLTDNGTGDYTVNFTNAFGAADYFPATLVANDGISDVYRTAITVAPTASAFRYIQGGAGNFDTLYCGASIHGDLA